MHGSYCRRWQLANWLAEIVTFALTWPLARLLSLMHATEGKEPAAGDAAPGSSRYARWAQDPLRCQARFTQDYFGRWAGW